MKTFAENIGDWTTPIKGAQLEVTEDFTYQCNTDRDYEAHLWRKSKAYAEPQVTKLVIDGKRVE